MSHAHPFHVTTVTATATVTDNSVNVHVDVTYPPHQQISYCRDSHLQALTSHKMASAPMTHPSSFWSPETLSSSDFNIPSASTVPAAEMNSVHNVSEFHNSHPSEHPGWCASIDSGEGLYWQTDFLVNNGTIDYGQYDTSLTNGLGNLGEHSGNHALQDSCYRDGNHWTASSSLDQALYSDGYSEWSVQGGSVQHNMEATCQFNDTPIENGIHSEEMRYNTYELSQGTICHNAPGNSENIYPDIPHFPLSCSQFPGPSLSGNYKESTTQRICQAADPFQENVGCGLQWQESNIQESFTDPVCLSGMTDNRDVKTFQETDIDHHEHTKCIFVDDLSNKSNIKGKREQSLNTKHNARDAGKLICNRSKDVTEKTSLFTSNSISPSSLNGLPLYQEQMNHQQHQRMKSAMLDSHSLPQSKLDISYPSESERRITQHNLPEKQNRHTSFFISETHDDPSSTNQSNSLLPQTVSRSVSPLNQSKSSALEPSSLPPTSSISKTKTLSPTMNEAPQQLGSNSLNTSSQSAVDSQPRKHVGSESLSDSSLSPTSYNTQSAIDVDHLLSTGITVAGFKPRPIIRKRAKVMIPPTHKDGSYWHKRKKNNDSAKKSREAKKQKEKNFYRRALELEYENYFLKERLGQMEAQLHAMTGGLPGPATPPVIPPMPPLPPSVPLPPSMSPVSLSDSFSPLPPPPSMMVPLCGRSSAINCAAVASSVGPSCVA